MALQVSNYTVVDNNRQLTNITGIDATTAAAIGAGGVGGGGEIEITAHPDGLSSGDLVGIDANGKGKKISSLATINPNFGTETPALPNGNVSLVKAMLNDAETHVCVLCYTASRYVYALIGSIDADAGITWGSWTQVASSAGGNGYGGTSAFLHVGDDRWVAVYSKGATHYGRVITRSGTTVSMGSETWIASSNGNDPIMDHHVIYDGNGTVIFAYYYSNVDYLNSFKVSGTTITAGTQYSFSGAPTGWSPGLAWDPDNNKFIFIHNTSTSSSQHMIGTANSNGTLSYTTTNHSHYAGDGEYIWKPPFVIDGILSYPPAYKTYTVNSNSTTTVLSSSYYLELGQSSGYYWRIPVPSGSFISNYNFSHNSQQIVIKHSKITYDTSTGQFTVPTATTLFESDTGLGAQNTYIALPSLSPTNNLGVLTVRSYAYANRLYVAAFDIAASVADSMIGVSQGNYSGNTTATIAVAGGTSDTQTGLTAGKPYKLDLLEGVLIPNDGGVDASGQTFAIALSSTKIAIK